MKQAIILAAGEGQRLRPFTANKPKVMLSLAGKPILHYVVGALEENGIRDIVLVVGYRREQIFDYMGSGERFGVEITYVFQERQLGTAHALAQARGVAGDEFLVLSGDKLISAGTIAQFACARPGTILVKPVENPSRYGVVTIKNGLVKDVTEQLKEPKGNMVSTRIYSFTREVFDFIEPELLISDVLNNMVAQGRCFYAQETDGPWLDVVYPWDMLSFNSVVLRQIEVNLGGTVERGVSLKGKVSVGKGTIIRANSSIIGPVVIGEGCDIGPNVCILANTSIGDNVIIAPFSEVRDSVIGSDVYIGPGCIIEDSVVDGGCVLQGRVTACGGQAEIKINDEYHSVKVGAILGEGCDIGSGVVARPGVIIGNYSQVEPLKLVSGWLPDRSLVF